MKTKDLQSMSLKSRKEGEKRARLKKYSNKVLKTPQIWQQTYTKTHHSKLLKINHLTNFISILNATREKEDLTTQRKNNSNGSRFLIRNHEDLKAMAHFSN